MNQRWTLHVENFARIDSADIEIAPLLCFVGDNNSGKSYIMTLLWGIIASGNFFLQDKQRTCPESPEYAKCNEWLMNNLDKKVEINSEVAQRYVNWFNKILNSNKDKLMRNFFNHEMSVGKMEIRDFSINSPLVLNLRSNATQKIYRYAPINDTTADVDIDVNLEDLSLMVELNFVICWQLLMAGVIMPPHFFEEKGAPVYLPSSRTGFLLARREINNASIVNTFSLPDSESRFQEKLTKPYIHFLKMLNDLTDSEDPIDDKKIDLAKFLQKKILHGSVRVKEDGKVIRYLPEDVEQELPMSITSSVVTEIASLLLLLTTKLPLRLIIIEEPEAHLHPALQKKIAQFLIRLVHNGFPIWITTHSDTILQHFNNMIKLNNRSDDERKELLQEFHYSEEDLLSSDEINLYQFERGEQHTAIKKLESGKYGFVANLFNKAIDELVNEIYAFQEVE